MNSIEQLSSRSLYGINKELITIKYNKKNRTLNIRKVGALLSYIKHGYFSRIINRTKEFAGVDNHIMSEYTLKEYESYPNVKVVVYTCIWGKYDRIQEPLYINPNIDYCIITDQKINESSNWKQIELPENIKRLELTPTEINRYCKMLPHKLFPEYDYSIYIDGNIAVVTDMFPIIADMNEKGLGVHKYPLTDCIYDMGKSIVAGKKASEECVYEQLKKYENEGFPKHFGAYECNILVRNHNSKKCSQLMENWWEEFNLTSTKRDQLSFAYVLWKNKYNLDDIHILGSNVRLNPRFQILDHIR